MPQPLSSPNFDTRKDRVRFVILHYSGMMDTQEFLRRLCDPAVKLSAHYAIAEDGTLYHLVAEERRAWHAGVSFWQGCTDLNSASLGIELANPGHEFGYRPFPAPQIAALKSLLRDIQQRYALPHTAFLAHSDIAPRRKEDPGELFPWQELAKEGFGLWPSPEAADYAPWESAEIAPLLRRIGYDAPDDDFAPCLRAFQRRYHPQHLGLPPDAETVARMRVLARLSANSF